MGNHKNNKGRQSSDLEFVLREGIIIEDVDEFKKTLNTRTNTELVSLWAATRMQMLKSKKIYKIVNYTHTISNIVVILGAGLYLIGINNPIARAAGLSLDLSGMVAAGVCGKILKKCKQNIELMEELVEDVVAVLDQRGGGKKIDDAEIFPDIFKGCGLENKLKNREEISYLFENI